MSCHSALHRGALALNFKPPFLPPPHPTPLTRPSNNLCSMSFHIWEQPDESRPVQAAEELGLPLATALRPRSWCTTSSQGTEGKEAPAGSLEEAVSHHAHGHLL